MGGHRLSFKRRKQDKEDNINENLIKVVKHNNNSNKYKKIVN